MPWHKSDAKKGYFFAFRPGLNRNILVFVRGLYPGVYGSLLAIIILFFLKITDQKLFSVGPMKIVF
jgi:hypothetical protein